MANTYIYRDLGTPTNAYKGTVSHWIKKSIIGANNSEYGTFAAWLNGGSTTRTHLNFYNNTIYFYDQQNSIEIQTNRVFRDTNAWYHIVVAWDTTQSTASNRVKIYVNGVQETSFSTATYPSQNAVLECNTSGRRFGVGTLANGSGVAYGFWDGSISHFHFIDGTQYAASDFGSTDSTTGEWKINTSPSVTYGNNGFFWLKDNITTTDNSPNSNTFTVGGGTLTKTEDCPSNVFATFNPLLDVNAKPTLSNGNTTMAGAAISSAQFAGSTICVSNGKWYFEAKVTPNSSSPYVGVIDAQSTLRKNANYFVHTASGTNQSGYAVNMSGDIYHNNSNSYAANIGSISSGDILGFAIDLDSAQRTCEIYKNGASQRSFNLDEPTSGAYMLGCCSSYNTASASVNFGNGYFGTTAVSSAGTNASGNGIFEYDVPANFTALSTKGLNL
mgnify:CR=1 FL=1